MRLGASLRFPSNKVPANILLADDHTLPAKWLCWFSTEARKLDSELYPPKTLQHYLMRIQRHTRKQKEKQINLMTVRGFIVLRNLLDSLYRKPTHKVLAVMRSQLNISHRRMKRNFGTVVFSIRTRLRAS